MSVAASLDEWHRILRENDFDALPAIIREDAAFVSPAVFKPYQGREAMMLVLSTAAKVFEDFKYHRSFATEEGRDIVLEFSARVGDRELEGADFIRFDSDGLIEEFKVMVRPMSGLHALAAAMATRLGGGVAAAQSRSDDR